MRGMAATLGVALQVNALPTSLMAAVGPPTTQQLVILRLEPGKLNLRKLAMLNELYDRIRARSIDFDTTLTEIASIDSIVRPRPPIITIAAYALLSLGASILLGGGPREMQVSTLTGLAIGCIAAISDRNAAVERLYEVLAAFVATLVVAGYETLFGPVALYIAIIAGVVQLLPGFTLTSALHELAGRQLVAGTARLGGVLVTLLSLGCGFALGVAIVGPGLFAAPTLSPVHAPGLMVIPAALFMAAAIAVILRARFQDFGWVCASCVIAIVASRVFATLPGHQVAAFGAAFVVGVLTNLGARYWKIPQAVVLVPGILVLVPGSLSYESILYVFQNDVTNALDIAVDVGLAAILIVAGTLLSQIVVRPASSPSPIR
jgi:uncharacterized membrane protein YjjP (DUF1212 family)